MAVSASPACCWAAISLTTLCLDHDPVHGQHRGIFWVEVGVAVTVTGVMLKIFYMFADRAYLAEEEE